MVLIKYAIHIFNYIIYFNVNFCALNKTANKKTK